MLINALRLNALFSMVSALFILVMRIWLHGQIPLPLWSWIAIAVCLVGFSLILIYLSFHSGIAQKEAPSIITADIAWVGLTLVLMFVFFDSITGIGVSFIAGVNVAVASLALFQYKGWRVASIERDAIEQ